MGSEVSYTCSSIAERLKRNSYPGRGIVLGISSDGTDAVIAYFTMGRSVNSRNRIFIEDGMSIKNKAFDISKLSDPTNVIYAPIKVFDNATIVTNGNQTDTIYDYISNEDSFENALMTRTFEDDPPNYTPRISGIVEIVDGNAKFKLSILKSMDGDPSSVLRFFFNFYEPLPGVGHFIHTYSGDGDPLPSFEGEPKPVEICSDIDEFTDAIWSSLNEDNKVSLATRYISLESGNVETRIKNKLV
jgi:hypothetical protein